MTELFELFKYAFLLCPLAGVTLCIVGSHLVARNQSLQLIALAQAALLGNLLGNLLGEIIRGVVGKFLALPFLFSILFFVLAKTSFVVFDVRRESAYIAFYLFLIAQTYFFVTFFPALDASFTAGFFGDIVSISAMGALALSGFFLALLVLYLFFHAKFVRLTMERAIFGSSREDFWEELFYTSTILVSLYSMGYLFTLAFSIVPVVVAGRSFGSLKQSLLWMSLGAALASAVGLALSISFSRIATVPAQVLCLVSVIFLLRVFSTRRNTV